MSQLKHTTAKTQALKHYDVDCDREGSTASKEYGSGCHVLTRTNRWMLLGVQLVERSFNG